jgi:O-succinylbenzoate synthase
MRIDRVRVVRTPLEMVSPLRTSDGQHESRIATLVEVRDSDGVIGWGENVAPAGVAYVDESTDESLKATCELIAPLLAGRDIDVFEMLPESWWGVSGHNFAKHAVESAVWDIHARRESKSLRDVLGGTRSVIVPGVVVGIADTVEETVMEVQQRIAEGYGRVKVKISPGRDADVLRAIRSSCGDELLLQADANAAYSNSDIAYTGKKYKMSKEDAIEKIADFFKKDVFPKVRKKEPELLDKIKKKVKSQEMKESFLREAEKDDDEKSLKDIC